jgi:hypothetical protein
MNREPHDQRPLFEPWLAWKDLPEATRQQVLDVLTALYLQVTSPPQESDTDASSND